MSTCTRRLGSSSATTTATNPACRSLRQLGRRVSTATLKIAGSPRVGWTIRQCCGRCWGRAQSGPIAQPTLVAYDPANANIIVAGGRESGVFLSSDGGAHWTLITDPYTPGVSGIPHLPRPFFAHFQHITAESFSLFIGTVGRGIWRIDFGVNIHFPKFTPVYWRLIYGLVDDSPGASLNIVAGEVKPVPPRFIGIIQEMVRYEVASNISDESGLEAKEVALKSMQRPVEQELLEVQRKKPKERTPVKNR